ncbi:hypothetical protein GCM10027176_21640 [Actinoallomurus bryophytorum]|uniref:Uncharacterized protein n=1 Tax=Actinoallomurus bryophytorum TaxID=1490222 RepID=A0A543CKZ9_9ACTN|nr:hypothetical protein FB559_3161 [Actinoallomurus bryophytorum]
MVKQGLQDYGLVSRRRNHHRVTSAIGKLPTKITGRHISSGSWVAATGATKHAHALTISTNR